MMEQLSKASRTCMYVTLSLMGFYVLLVTLWQIQVMRGSNGMKNPDGTSDDWHEQKVFYGIATADLFVGLPVTVAALVCLFRGKTATGHYLFSMVAYWFVWANVMTTATSLRFENPAITAQWIIAFPSGIVLGLAYIVWVLHHFDAIFGSASSRASYTPIPEG